MDITKIQSAGYNITYIAQPGETGPRVLVDLRSPFSREATAAIKASFTADQWETIKAWGKTADAYLIAAVNQFAVEDPRIMYSLVAGLGIHRQLFNNAGSQHNYFLTDIVPTNDISVDFEFVYNGLRTTSNYNVLFGSSPQGNTSGGQTFYAYIKANAVAYSFCHSEGLQDLTMSFVNGSTIRIIEDIPTVSVTQGETEYTKSTGKSAFASTPVYPMAIFENFRNGAITNDPQVIGAFRHFICNNNGQTYHFVPFITTRDRDANECYPARSAAAGSIGLIDLVSGRFHPNCGSGTFTELIEPPAS